MDHVTSNWAREFGLRDPGVTADDVLASRPDSLRRLADRGRAAATALRDGAEGTRRAASTLQPAWSSPAPLAAVRSLAHASAVSADICDGNAAAIAECADALLRTREEVTRAYAAADATIAAEGIGADWAPAFGMIDVDRARRQCHVVTTLSVAVDRAADDARRAAARLCAAIGPNPCPGGVALAETPGAPDPSARSDNRNRELLSADLTSASPKRRAFARRISQALAHGAAISGGAPVQLLDYDPDHPPGQGSAAIAVGDVSAADSVAVLVPGILSSPSVMSGPLDSAAALNRSATKAAPGTTAATVLWMGYDIPGSAQEDVVGSWWDKPGDDFAATNADAAVAGGISLAGFCVRLRQQMGASAGLTLVGHSYGSTVVSQAAGTLGRGVGVDDIVLLGSPGAGLGIGDASDYSAVPADHVYALAFPDDPVPRTAIDAGATVANPIKTLSQDIVTGSFSGVYGDNPTSGGFGAQVIDARGAEPGFSDIAPILKHAPDQGLLGAIAPVPDWVPSFSQHAMDNYLGGAALTAIGAIVAGRYATVPVRPQR